MKKTVEKQVIPIDVTPELITTAVTAARRWYRPLAGMYTLAAAIAAGWRGQPMSVVCRPSRDGIGGDYWHIWDGGEVCQRTRSCPPSAVAILDAMREEYDRQSTSK